MRLRRLRLRRSDDSMAAWCGKHEYFDVVVKECAQCVDVCQPHQQSLDFCIRNCQQYYCEHIQPQVGLPDCTRQPSTTLSASRSTYSTRSPLQNYMYLVKQPLFWTSVISMFVAFVSLVAIFVLCITHARRRRRACAAPSGSQSAMSNEGQHEKLCHDHDDVDSRMTFNCADDIYLRSMTPPPSRDYHAEKRCSPGYLECHPQTLLSTAGGDAAVTSRFLDKLISSLSSWWSRIPGRHQSRPTLATDVNHYIPVQESAVDNQQYCSEVDSCIVGDDCCNSVITTSGCFDDETSQKLLVSSDDSDHQCQLSSAVTSTFYANIAVRSRQSSDSDGVADDTVGADIMSVCQVISERDHNHQPTAASLGYSTLHTSC